MWRPHKIQRIIPFYCTWSRRWKHYYVVEYIALESKCECVWNLHNVPLRPILSITLVILFRSLLAWRFDFPTASWNLRCKGLHDLRPLGLTLRNLLSWFLLSLGFSTWLYHWLGGFNKENFCCVLCKTEGLVFGHFGSILHRLDCAGGDSFECFTRSAILYFYWLLGLHLRFLDGRVLAEFL